MKKRHGKKHQTAKAAALVVMLFLAWLIPEVVVKEYGVIEGPPQYPTHLSVLKSPDKEEPPPYLGVWRVTVYTPYCDGGVWGYKTASGETSEHLATCAVDPAVVPLGTILDVGGLPVRAIDTGSAVKGNTVDIFFDGTPAEATDWLSKFGDSAPVWLQQGVAG